MLDIPQVDLDLGNYERFMDLTLHKDNNITTGKVYQVKLFQDLSALTNQRQEHTRVTACMLILMLLEEALASSFSLGESTLLCFLRTFLPCRV